MVTNRSHEIALWRHQMSGSGKGGSGDWRGERAIWDKRAFKGDHSAAAAAAAAVGLMDGSITV